MKTELTVAEAARELGVKKQAIFIAIRRGRLAARKREVPPFGEVLFIRRPAFEVWAAESAVRREAQHEFRRSGCARQKENL